MSNVPTPSEHARRLCRCGHPLTPPHAQCLECESARKFIADHIMVIPVTIPGGES